MIIDTTLIFSSLQTVTTSTASTNIIDLGATGTPYGASNPLVRNIGNGKPIELSVSVATTFVGLTSLQVSVQTSSDGATWTSVDTGAAIAAAKLVSGYQFHVPKIVQEANCRYLQLYYTVSGTASAGAINASIVASRQSNGA